MNIKVEKLMRNWFFGDPDIEIKATKDGESIYLIFESNVSYFEGERRKGDKRCLWIPAGEDDILFEEDDILYDEIRHLCDSEKGLDETLDVLLEIEALGFSLN